MRGNFRFYWFLSFHIERCRKCESHDEDFFFVLKNASQHLKNRPHGEERKNIFHDIFGENVIMLICWDIHMFQTEIFKTYICIVMYNDLEKLNVLIGRYELKIFYFSYFIYTMTILTLRNFNFYQFHYTFQLLWYLSKYTKYLRFFCIFKS